MRKLPLHKRVQILSMMVDGSSMRSISRVAGVSINTVTKLLIDAGEACAAYHDEHVRNVIAARVQCDEIWSFCYAKEANVRRAKAAPFESGDVWTWTALDADSKLIISYLVGDRDAYSAFAFMQDLKSRLATRVQLTTDGHHPYVEAVKEAFGKEVDFAQLVKIYSKLQKGPGVRSRPTVCVGAKKAKRIGSPDRAHISTSFVERQNLNIRMGNRRFTRLTNAFSKRLHNHVHMLSLYFLHYNFCRIHGTLKVSPAMAAGVSDTLYDMEWVVGLIDARAPKPGRPKHYKKQKAS